MISVQEAWSHIAAHAVPLPTVELPTADALGRALAEEVASDRDSPPWDKALVDGYAVRASDVAAPDAIVRVIEEVTAGRTPQLPIGPGEATRIMTGAPLPQGADAVAMVERTAPLPPDRVQMLAAVRPEQNVLRRGASMRQGEVILPPGRTIRPIEVGLLAEVGRTRVRVHRAPRVALLATGDELVEAAQQPTGGQIRNSNGPMLAALTTAAGAEPIPLGIARDTAADLREKIAQGLAADLLILSGGVSAGVLDLVPHTLAELGVRPIFHQVNLKPGKPLWFGVREQTLVFGLPGNPVSTLVCFGLFVQAALARLSGNDPAKVHAVRRAHLSVDFHQRDARPTYFPARRTWRAEQGREEVAPLAWKGSADLRTLADANCLAYFPGGERHFAAGDEVETYPL